jgi:hypothetical protein
MCSTCRLGIQVVSGIIAQVRNDAGPALYKRVQDPRRLRMNRIKESLLVIGVRLLCHSIGEQRRADIYIHLAIQGCDKLMVAASSSARKVALLARD